MDMNEMRLEAQDLNQQAVMLIQAGNLEVAKQKLDKAVELDPMLIDSYKNYGDLYMTAGEYQDAKNSYKKALLIEKRGNIYFLYGNACFMSDEVHEGLEYYNRAVTAGYDSEDMMFFMGMAYEHLNDDNMALRYFQKACIKNPSRPDYILKKINALIRLDMLEDAEKAVDDFILNSPEVFDGYHLKTQLLVHRGALEEATAFSKSATERFPEDVDLFFDYVKCITLSKDFDQACKLIEIAGKMKYFADAKYRFRLLEAQIAAESGDAEKAIKCCEECVGLEEIQESHDEARFMLMNMYLATSEYDKALNSAKELIEKDQKDSFYYAALYYRAFCTSKMGQEEEAKQLYEEAKKMYRMATIANPAAIDAYMYRAMCMKDLGEYDKALEMLDFVCGLTTEVAEVYTLRADIYQSMEKPSQAKEEMEKAYKLKPELRELYEGEDK